MNQWSTVQNNMAGIRKSVNTSIDITNNLTLVMINSHLINFQHMISLMRDMYLTKVGSNINYQNISSDDDVLMSDS